jgi:hypothetical protein
MVAVLPTLFVIAVIIVIILIIVNIVFILSLPTCGAASGISCSFRNGVFWTNVAILIIIILLGILYYAFVRVRRTALFQCAYGGAAPVSVVTTSPAVAPLGVTQSETITRSATQV